VSLSRTFGMASLCLVNLFVDRLSNIIYSISEIDDVKQCIWSWRMKGRGPDKTKRKKRVYPATVRVQLKLSPEIIQWVRLKGKRKTSKFIEHILWKEHDMEQEYEM